MSKSETRTVRTSLFREKNANRKAGMAAAVEAKETRGTIRQARQLRQLFSGAFGNLPAADWNDMIVGTTGKVRATKRPKAAASA